MRNIPVKEYSKSLYYLLQYTIIQLMKEGINKKRWNEVRVDLSAGGSSALDVA